MTSGYLRILEHLAVADGPPAQLHLSGDVLLGDEAPLPAVVTVVPMIAHYEVVALGDHLRTPVVVAAVFLRDEAVVDGNAVAEPAAGHDPHLIPFGGDPPLHERLVRLQRAVQH